MKYSIEKVATLIGARRYGTLQGDIRWLLTDSRSLCFPEETLFFALKTQRNDGHRYIDDLYRRGVRHFVVEQVPEHYEVRFPEVARDQRRKGADILLMPTAWAAGELKSLHFRTLITARALENGVYVLACDQCGSGTIGESVAVDPMGVPVAAAGAEETLLLVRTDTDRVQEVRRRVASFDQRRPELYRL